MGERESQRAVVAGRTGADDAAELLLHLVELLHRVVAPAKNRELTSSRLRLIIEAHDGKSRERSGRERVILVHEQHAAVAAEVLGVAAVAPNALAALAPGPVDVVEVHLLRRSDGHAVLVRVQVRAGRQAIHVDRRVVEGKALLAVADEVEALADGVLRRHK